MKRLSIFLTCTALFVLTANIGIALEGNARKGKFLYRKHCRTCHGSTASDLSPLSKTQAEWTALAESHAAIPCAKDWAEVGEGDRKDIFAYLYGFAKDSPTPAKCD